MKPGQRQANSVSCTMQLPKFFYSGRWKRGYNPDIAFASHSIVSLNKKLVLEPLPRSQHRPDGITVNSAVSIASIPNRRRFNLTKANWKEVSDELQHLLQELEPTPDNSCGQFSEIVRRTSRRNILRGCYTNYISGLTLTARKCFSRTNICTTRSF